MMLVVADSQTLFDMIDFLCFCVWMQSCLIAFFSPLGCVSASVDTFIDTSCSLRFCKHIKRRDVFNICISHYPYIVVHSLYIARGSVFFSLYRYHGLVFFVWVFYSIFIS